MLMPRVVRYLLLQVEGFDAARSDNLRRFEVRAAGVHAFALIPPTVVRMVRPMHYEGANERALYRDLERRDSLE